MGGLCYCVCLAIFIYFAERSYATSITQKFISLDPSSGICETVPISVTASYYGDTLGNWEGTPGFVYYESILHFSFNNFEVSSVQEYQQMMGVFNTSLHYYGELSSRQNLGLNVVLWMSLVRYYSTADPLTSNFSSTGRGNLQFMELTGDPAVIFKSRFTGVALSASSGFCEIPAVVNFDQANALFQASVSSSDYASDPICKSIVSPFVFSDTIEKNPHFNIELDSRSVAVAIAANLGYLDSEDLLLASASTFRINIPVSRTLNVTYEIGEYFDVRYPYMKPMFCLKNVSFIPNSLPHVLILCLVNTGTGLFLPVINHLGHSMKQPDYCDCQNGKGRDTQCNQLYLMAGLIVFPSNISSPTDSSAIRQNIRDAYALVAKHGNYANLNRASFDASSASVLQSLGTADSSIVNNAYINNAFRFCRLPNGAVCSMVVFYTLGMSVAVSKYHYPIVEGSCKNVLTITNDHWENLALNPPTPLQQIYYSCLPSSFDTLIDAIGIASGNTSIAVLLLLFICFPIVIVVMACCRVYPRSLEFSDKEKLRTLDTLATLILRIRDDQDEGVTKNGTISEVAGEMMKAVAYSNHKLISESPKDEHDLDNNAHAKHHLNGVQTLTEDEIEEHKGYLGRVYIYRHRTTDHHGNGAKTAPVNSHHHDHYDRVEEGGSPVSAVIEAPTLRECTFSFCFVVRFDLLFLFLGLRIMNLYDVDINIVVNDPSWEAPYNSKRFSISFFFICFVLTKRSFLFHLAWKLLFKGFFIISPILSGINFFVKKERDVPIMSCAPCHYIKPTSSLRKGVFSPRNYSKSMSMIFFSTRMIQEPLILLRMYYVCMLPWIRDMI
jgi:hypothetical protein